MMPPTGIPGNVNDYIWMEIDGNIRHLLTMLHFISNILTAVTW